jgi:hypothetical protein
MGFIDRFSLKSLILNFMEITPVVKTLVHAARQTDGRDEFNKRFSLLCERSCHGATSSFGTTEESHCETRSVWQAARCYDLPQKKRSLRTESSDENPMQWKALLWCLCSTFSWFLSPFARRQHWSTRFSTSRATCCCVTNSALYGTPSSISL